MFSRIASDFTAGPNRLSQAVARRREAGLPVVDLIDGNPTRHGLRYPVAVVQQILREVGAGAALYAPDPRGQLAARGAICDYYQTQGVDFSAEHLILTPGTSQAYWYLFQLLADPGQEILVPQPSYPLFDYIAALCHVTLRPYPLDPAQAWAIDLDRLAAAITPGTRAIVLISPHNPTGQVATPAEVAGLADLAAAHALPIIADEVFSEFVFDGLPPARPAQTNARLVFTLNGFSKLLALPGHKLGWIAVSGQEALVEKAVLALETMADTFLAASEVSQLAAPALLAQREPFLTTYRTAVARRAASTQQLLTGSALVSFNPPRGGFYLAIDVSRLTRNDENLALDLLLETGILVHPGWFYDIPTPHLILSFLAEEDVLARELPRLRAFLESY
jgi:hypothetical protein